MRFTVPVFANAAHRNDSDAILIHQDSIPWAELSELLAELARPASGGYSAPYQNVEPPLAAISVVEKKSHDELEDVFRRSNM
jgi:hypothetical protein